MTRTIQQLFDLKGQTALITGGSRGLGLQMAEALRANGKPVELALFDKAGHGFHRWQDNMVAYRKTEDFLARCLGGRTGGFDFFELGAKLF